jgi:hypothetical protein
VIEAEAQAVLRQVVVGGGEAVQAVLRELVVERPASALGVAPGRGARAVAGLEAPARHEREHVREAALADEVRELEAALRVAALLVSSIQPPSPVRRPTSWVICTRLVSARRSVVIVGELRVVDRRELVAVELGGLLVAEDHVERAASAQLLPVLT